MISIYIISGIFPIILSGYHLYLTFYLKATTNENCKGIKTKEYFKYKNRRTLWNPRKEIDYKRKNSGFSSHLSLA